MALYLIGSLGLFAVALAQHFILQSAGQGDHARFLGVFLKELLSLGLCSLGLLFLFLLEESLYGSLSVHVGHGSFSGKDVADGLCKIVDIQFGCVHLLELMTNAHAQRVTCLVHFYCLKLIINNVQRYYF